MDNFYVTPLGVFVNSCNVVSGQVLSGVNFYELVHEYPVIFNEIENQLLDINSLQKIDISLVTTKIRMFIDALAEGEESPVLSLLWSNFLKSIGACIPNAARYVVRFNEQSTKAFSGMKYFPTPMVLDGMFQKARKILSSGLWVSRTVLLLRAGMSNEIIDALVDSDLLVNHPTNRDLIALSRGALINPDFTGIYKGRRSYVGANTPEQIARAKAIFDDCDCN